MYLGFVSAADIFQIALSLVGADISPCTSWLVVATGGHGVSVIHIDAAFDQEFLTAVTVPGRQRCDLQSCVLGPDTAD
jgi:hypothetical protein